MSDRTLIGYVRVSTAQQGRSGLGLEAQREAMERFAVAEGFTLGRVFVEVRQARVLTLSTVARSLQRH